MNVDAVNLTAALPKVPPKSSEASEEPRRLLEAVPEPQKKEVQPEELLSQIKGLTENGLYSVRFENDRVSKALVVKVVDRQTDAVIRQIPSEELLDLSKRLNELRGNLVDTQS